jgi:DNA-binding transcriptional MerR regulator
MTLIPVASGARLLGIHPKTLRHWLTAAQFPLAAHPTDARLRCVAEQHLLELAKQHGRPLPALSPLLVPQSEAASAFAAEQVTPLPAQEGEPAHQAAVLPAPSAALAALLQQLSQLHTQLATLQHHLTGLTLAVLHERSGLDEDLLHQRLRPLEGRVPQPRESLGASSQTDGAGLLAPSPLPAYRPLPVEVRARSRVSALIEYGAQGQYVAVCPKLGVLSLVPDSPAWFDWLASLTSFRFMGPPGRFSACRASEKGQYTRCWAARRWFHGHDFWHYLGVTDRLTLASLEQAATALQARVDAL